MPHGIADAVNQAGPHRTGWMLLVALAAWAAAPLVALLAAGRRSGRTFLGVDGPFAADQLQYLSWIRESGEHLLIGNQFDLAPTRDVFVHPMFLVSGLVWRAGVHIGASFQLWKPVAVVVLFGGVAAYVRRLLPPGWTRLVAAIIGLFYVAPAAAVAAWTGVGGPDRSELSRLAGELFTAGSLWGYLPTAVTLGLLPVCLLGFERLLDVDRRAPGRGTAWYAGWTAVGGAAVSWLHPWQGEALLLVVGGLVLWTRAWSSIRVLALPVLITALPLLAYLALSQLHDAWSIAQVQNEDTRFALWVLPAALLPLALPAAAAWRLETDDAQERMLRLWPFAALLVYLVFSPSVPQHGWAGAAIPLGVLAARGGQRIWARLPAASAALGTAAAVVAVGVLVVPGVIFLIQQYNDLVLVAERQPHLITSDEDRALQWLRQRPGAGGVLATSYLGAAVPPFTGRATWVGHPSWTPHFGDRAARVEQLFDGSLTSDEAMALVRETGARFVIDDCRHRLRPDGALARLLRTGRNFGCAAVFEVDGSP